MSATVFNPQLVLYIPRMNTYWASPEKITEVFHKQNIGIVSRVEIIKKKVPKERKEQRKHLDGGNYIRSAHVYFTTWHDTTANRNLQTRILDPKLEGRLVFDDPWYWLLIESNRNKDESRLRHIELVVDDLNEQMNTIRQKEEETKAVLYRQNEAIQRLQDFCMAQGLTIPFWDSKYPPPEEVSSIEALSAATAAYAANHVLNDDNHRYKVGDIIPYLDEEDEYHAQRCPGCI
jgi:hypothetical protein